VGSVLYFSEREPWYFWGGQRCLASGGLEALSAVESGIDRPHSGSDHRHGHAQASQHGRGQRIAQRREQYPGLNKGNRNPGYWRPQAQQQKYARKGRDQMREIGRKSSALRNMHGPEIKESRARHYTLQ